MFTLHFHSKDVFLDNKFGKSTGPVWLEQLSCTGTEHDISGCLPNWKANTCNNTVGISCGNYSISEMIYNLKITSGIYSILFIMVLTMDAFKIINWGDIQNMYVI